MNPYSDSQSTANINFNSAFRAEASDPHNNCYMNLRTCLENVQSLELVSASIPYTMHLFSLYNNRILFTLSDGTDYLALVDTTQFILTPSGLATAVAAAMNDATALLTGDPLPSGTSFTVAYTSSHLGLTVTCTGDTFVFAPIHGNPYNILGLANVDISTYAASFTSTEPITLLTTKYIYILCDEIPQSTQSNIPGLEKCVAYLRVNENLGSVIGYQATLNNPTPLNGSTLQTLTFRLVGDDGLPIDQSVAWSAHFKVQYAGLDQ